MFPQIITELFLRAAANRDHHMCRAILFHQREKISVFDFQSVPRRDVTIFHLDWQSFAPQPINQFSSRAFVRQDPENLSGPLAFQFAEQMLQIFETGNALEVFALQQAPQEDHQPAVSNRQISSEHGAPIPLIFAQSRETGSRRSDEKSSVLKHRRERFINIAVEEANAENLSAGSH